MSFTMIALQAKFTNADGSPASGTVCATPNSHLENFDPGGEPQTMEPVCGLLDPNGRLVSQSYQSLVIAATDDPGTIPIGASYTFTIKLDGQDLVEFSSPLPSDPQSWPSTPPPSCSDDSATTVTDSPTIALVDLLASPTMVGAQVMGPAISGTAHVLSANRGTNTITIDANATETGAGGVIIEGGCFPLTTLWANAL